MTRTPGVKAAGFTLLSQPSTEMLEEACRLRPKAWRARSCDFPDIDIWRDAFDDCSDHWVVVHFARVVAAGRLTIRDRIEDLPNPELYAGFDLPDAGRVASINRLVVDADYAGLGLSRMIDEARIAHADAQGVRVLLATTFAGRRRVTALERLGFRGLGDAKAYDDGPLTYLNRGASSGGGRAVARSLLRRGATTS